MKMDATPVEFNSAALADIAIKQYELLLENQGTQRQYQSAKEMTAQITFLKLLETVRPDLVTRTFILNTNRKDLVSTLVSRFSSDWRGKELLDIIEASSIETQFERLVAGNNVSNFLRGHYDEGPEKGVPERIIALIKAQPKENQASLLAADKVIMHMVHLDTDLIVDILSAAKEDQKVKILSNANSLYNIGYYCSNEQISQIEKIIESLPEESRRVIYSAVNKGPHQIPQKFEAAMQVEPSLI